jgi:glycine cleavage system T protein
MSRNEFIFKEELSYIDPDVKFLTQLEDERQERKIIMIASESLCPKAVKETLASNFTNIYAEGYPSLRMTAEEKEELTEYRREIPLFQRFYDRRYYKGCDYVDFVEALAMLRLSKLFETKEISAEKIFTNVQSLSGAAANNAVYEAFINPGDTIMGMNLSHGGHLTHGSPVNRSGKRYNVVHYGVDSKTGILNFASIEKLALEHKPKIIIAGYSAYPWDIDWVKFKEIAEKSGSLLMADIAHIAGLIVAGQCNNPIGFADIVTFTTHKTMCGPRGAVILSTNREIAKKINNAVFPGEQGGPHINNIAAKAVAFKLAGTEQFRELQKRIKDNAHTLGEAFKELGLRLAYGGTDTHMVLIDLKTIKNEGIYELDGEMASRMLDICGIVCNKNTIAGDDKAARPSAVRFGTTWVSQRGMGPEEMKRIAGTVHKVLTSIKPFRYLWPGGYVGRGKILQSVMDDAKCEIDSLTKEFPGEGLTERRMYPYFDLPYQPDRETPLLKEHEKLSATLGDYHGYKMPAFYGDEEIKHSEDDCLLFDISDTGIIEVKGERAKAFLQAISTNNIYELKQGESQKSFIFDHNYKLLDDVIIMRHDSKRKDRDTFSVLSNAPNHLKLKRYFRALSLGYTLFDRDELFAKIEGPCEINDLRPSMSAMSLYGKKAPGIIRKIFPSVEELKEGHFAEHDMDGTSVIISHSCDVRYEFILCRKKAGELWNKILSTGVKPAGTEARDKLKEESGLPVYIDGEEREDILSLYKKNPSYFKLCKPYFTGQKFLLTKLGDTVKSDKIDFVFEEKEESLKRTGLFEEHQKLATKTSIVPFAGWEMPVKYSGIKEEHMAVRQGAGLFDVSHMGIFDFKGENAVRFLDLISANYIPRVQKGQAVYSYLLDADGIPIDDILVYGIDPPTHYMMVVNAANADKDWAWINAVKEKKVIINRENPYSEVDADVEIRNLRDHVCGKDRRADMALQGPKSLDILKTFITDRNVIWELENLKKFYFVRTVAEGMDLIIARTGYTGEEVGFEIYVHPDSQVKLWNLLLENGKKFGLKPTALGARDSTRTEAGLPLYGHELAGKFSLTPVEAGYGSFVKFHKPFFVGRAGSIEKDEKRSLEIVRFKMVSKGIRMVKPGNPVVSARGEYIGEVTSCALGTDDHQVGLACINRKFAKVGDKIGVFILPPKVDEKQKDHLKGGDKVILHETGEIVKRFPDMTSEKVCCEE